MNRETTSSQPVSPARPPVTCHFLALLSPQNEVYVLSTTSADFRGLYRSHLQGEHVETAALFHTVRSGLFLLETVEIPKEKSRGRCIVWSRRFHECGYTVVNWTTVEPYVLHPHPDDKAIYKKIRRVDLKKLCAPEKDLAANFIFKEMPHTIKLVVTPEELRTLKAAAVDKGLSLEVYCKRRFDSGSVESLDLSELRSCEQRCRQVVTLLEREKRLGLLSGGDARAHAWLQATTDALRQDVRTLTEAICEYAKGVRR